MSKHTPGPWSHIDGWRFVVSDCDGKIVASADTQNGRLTNKEVMANARLIAAAPDLLEALLEIERAPIVPELMTHDGVIETLLNWQQRARAAIAKATNTESKS